MELHPARIQSLAKTAIFGHPAILFERIASTNDAASAAAGRGAAEGTLIMAERQVQGRGRKGRIWISSAGKSLTFSIILKPPGGTEGITACAALGVAAALDGPGGRTRIKWPNDIWIGGRKAAGILSEAREGAVVVGVGVNVNDTSDDFPEELRGEVVSLRMTTGKIQDRGDVLCRILESFERFFIEWRESGFSAMAGEVEARLLHLGEEVVVNAGSRRFEGRFTGITAEGFLRLATESGERICPAGDVSLRKGRQS